ncbi:MAG: ATP-binding protein [Flavobacteriales bacterium]|jgi:predicted ATPase|nr:ATP-binding protein [Flavobacteriales bacterium]
MKKIGFRNLRSLREVEDITISPLTVIVGKNSSGKSTFLRSFPLLKQSLETKTNSPILWYDPNLVDFGSFSECVNNKAGDDEGIVFRFNFDLNTRDVFGFSFIQRRQNELEANVNLKLHIKKENDREYINLIEYEIDESTINILINKNSIVEDIVINKVVYTPKADLQSITLNKILPQLFSKEKDGISYWDDDDVNLYRILGTLTRKGTKKETLELMLRKFELGGYEKFYKSLFSKGLPKTWRNKLEVIEKDDKILIELHNYFLLSNLNYILEQSDKYLKRYFERVYYVAPLRATAERYYRQQGLAVDTIDSRGINLPMFLESLTRHELNLFQKWTRENFHFIPVVSKVGGHLSISISIKDQTINLADTGFGFSQVLPIITQLWSLMQRDSVRNRKVTKTFVIEQPELHLHPSIQALLIDTFVKVINTAKDNKVDIRIIFETHSETMINRLGQHIAYKKISSDNINVVVFESDGFETKTIIGNYDSKGRLRNWPIGFFYPDKIS